MLGVQLHIGSTELFDMLPIRNFMHKPKGGLWTSTYVDGSSDWVDWRELADWGVPSSGQWEGMLLEVDPSAKLYVIDSYEDLEKLMDSYKPYYPTPIQPFINYEAVSKDYDGIHLTLNGLWSNQNSKPYPLYGWDAESTIWFRDRFTKCQKISIPSDRKHILHISSYK